MMLTRRSHGFTLVELLVAIAIFAVLSAMGWKIFDYLNRVKEQNAMHEARLGELQDAFLQMQRDSLQMVPLTANVAGEERSALSLDNQRLTFSKAGVTDPLRQGLSPYERIEYVYNAQEQKLYRLKYPNLNIAANVQPLSSVLLSDLDQYQVTVMNPNELISWPEQNQQGETGIVVSANLPKGIRIMFKQRDVQYEWIFSLLNTDFLATPTVANNAS